MSRITIEVTEEQHRKIKVMASLQNKTIKELVLENLLDKPNKRFNRETIQALDDVKNKRNLTSYKTVDELFKKLGV